MPHQPFQHALYSEFARVGAALASDRRLELLDLLAQAPRHVEALAAETDMSVANVSQHLQTLRAAGLVEAERAGNRVVYRIADDSVWRLWLALRGVGERRLAEVERIVRDIPERATDEERLPRDALPALLQSDDVVLLDVRPAIEFDEGHLPGAQSLPVEELEQQLTHLPRDRRIVAYCRGSYCVFADEAVALLRRHGFDAVRLDGGWLEWRVEGPDDVTSTRSSVAPLSDPI